MLESDAPRQFEAAGAGAFGGLESGDGAEAAGIDLHVGRFVVAVVEDVGGLGAELEAGLLVERKALHERERKVGGTGADHAAHGGIAEAADADLVGGPKVDRQILIRKGRGIEPLGGGAPWRVERNRTDLIGTGLADSGEDIGVGGVDRLLIRGEERAGLQDSDTGQLPVADKPVHGGGGAQPALVFAQGQVIEIGGEEAVLAIIDDVAVVEAGMEAIGEEAASGDGEGVGGGAAGIGEVAREGVAGVEGHALAAVARDFDGGAGIVALGGILDALDDAPTGIGAVVGNQGAVTESAGAGSRCTGVGVGVA